MFRFVKHTQINKKLWDECVAASPQRTLYAFSWYLDIVAPQWNAVIYQREGRYHAVMPLPHSSKYGFSFVRQPLFAQQLGVFTASPELAHSAVLHSLKLALGCVNFIPHYFFNTANTVAFEQSNFEDELSGEEMPLASLEFFPHHTHLLPLNRPYQAIAQGYRRDRRARLQQAEAEGLQVVESAHLEPLIDMFRRSAEARIPGGAHPHTYEWLRALFQALHTRDQCRLLYAKNDKGRIGAGCLFAFDGNRVIYLFNAAYQHARRENGRTLIIDHLVRQLAMQNLALDFESPEAPAVADFYASFGAQAVPFYGIAYNRLPPWVNALWGMKRIFSLKG